MICTICQREMGANVGVRVDGCQLAHAGCAVVDAFTRNVDAWADGATSPGGWDVIDPNLLGAVPAVSL